MLDRRLSSDPSSELDSNPDLPPRKIVLTQPTVAMKHHLPFLALLLASVSTSLNITLCSDRGCRDPPLSTLVLDAPSGCKTAFAGLVQAVKVHTAKSEQEETPKAAKLAARFYRSTDCFAHCGTTHLITQLSNGSALTSPGPVAPAHSVMQSFEVVALDANGSYEPHGYCGLRHGDAAFFRGRTWKWRQVGRHARWRDGEPVFREVPFEEWDDDVHSRLEGPEYERHGVVDFMGKFKWEQYARGKWGSVPLEMWDDDVNVRNDEEFDMASLDEGLVEGVKKKLVELRAKYGPARRGEL
jgi:hypothetical protein